MFNLCYIRIESDSRSLHPTIASTRCFLLNQPDSVIICRACNETNSTETLWCISDNNEDGIVCSNNSETFDEEDYSDLNITPDGNVILTVARNAYNGKKLNCTRNCSDHRPQVHSITITIESMLHLYCVLFVMCYVCVRVCVCVCTCVCVCVCVYLCTCVRVCDECQL